MENNNINAYENEGSSRSERFLDYHYDHDIAVKTLCTPFYVRSNDEETIDDTIGTFIMNLFLWIFCTLVVLKWVFCTNEKYRNRCPCLTTAGEEEEEERRRGWQNGNTNEDRNRKYKNISWPMVAFFTCHVFIFGLESFLSIVLIQKQQNNDDYYYYESNGAADNENQLQDSTDNLISIMERIILIIWSISSTCITLVAMEFVFPLVPQTRTHHQHTATRTRTRRRPGTSRDQSPRQQQQAEESISYMYDHRDRHFASGFSLPDPRTYYCWRIVLAYSPSGSVTIGAILHGSTTMIMTMYNVFFVLPSLWMVYAVEVVWWHQNRPYDAGWNAMKSVALGIFIIAWLSRFILQGKCGGEDEECWEGFCPLPNPNVLNHNGMFRIIYMIGLLILAVSENQLSSIPAPFALRPASSNTRNNDEDHDFLGDTNKTMESLDDENDLSGIVQDDEGFVPTESTGEEGAIIRGRR